MATLNPCLGTASRHFGAIAPGYQADVLLLPDLERFEPELVLKGGKPVEEIHARRGAGVGQVTPSTSQPVAVNDFQIPWEGGTARVIGLVEGQIVTEALEEEPRVEDGFAVADPGATSLKIAVVERHLGTGRIGLGFVRGFGLQQGAMASTIAHDAHNIVVVGVDDGDMARAVQRLAEIGGGLVVIESRGVKAELPLPIAGLLSDAPLAEVVEASEACVEAARRARLHLSRRPSRRWLPGALGDPGAEDHRPRPGRRRPLRACPLFRRLDLAPTQNRANPPVGRNRSSPRPSARRCPPHPWRAPGRNTPCPLRGPRRPSGLCSPPHGQLRWVPLFELEQDAFDSTF